MGHLPALQQGTRGVIVNNLAAELRVSRLQEACETFRAISAQRSVSWMMVLTKSCHPIIISYLHFSIELTPSQL